jgi:hypothetical protein
VGASVWVPQKRHAVQWPEEVMQGQQAPEVLEQVVGQRVVDALQAAELVMQGGAGVLQAAEQVMQGVGEALQASEVLQRRWVVEAMKACEQAMQALQGCEQAMQGTRAMVTLLT